MRKARGQPALFRTTRRMPMCSMYNCTPCKNCLRGQDASCPLTVYRQMLHRRCAPYKSTSSAHRKLRKLGNIQHAQEVLTEAMGPATLIRKSLMYGRPSIYESCKLSIAVPLFADSLLNVVSFSSAWACCLRVIAHRLYQYSEKVPSRSEVIGTTVLSRCNSEIIGTTVPSRCNNGVGDCGMALSMD